METSLIQVCSVRKIRCTVLVLVVVLMVALSGCSHLGDSVDQGATGDASAESDAHPPGPLHPDTLLVDDENCLDVIEISDELRTISLSLHCDPTDFGLQPGRILLGSTHSGYLRRIDSLEFPDDMRAIASTSPATLAEAFTDIDIAGHWDFGSREVIDFSGRTLQGEEGASTFIAAPRGSLQVNPELAVDVKLGFLSVKRVEAILSVNLDVDLDGLFVHEASEEMGGFIDLETIHHPLDVEAGPTRLIGELRMVVRLGYRNLAAGPGWAQTAMVGSGRIEMGGTWTRPDSWENHWVPGFSGEVFPLEVHGGGGWEGELFVQVESYLSLQQVEGSSFRVEAWSGGDASGDCEEKNWTARGGLRGEAMMRLGFFDDGPRDEHMPDLDEPLAPLSGTVGAADGLCTDEAPPGGGPGDDDDSAAGDDGGAGADDGICAQATALSCGESVVGDTSGPLAGAVIDGYEGVVGNYEAPEQSFEWTASSSGSVEFGLVDPEPMSVDHDVFVLDAGSGLCLAGDFVNWGFHTVAFDAVAGATYLLIVDGYDTAAGAFTAQLDCSP